MTTYIKPLDLPPLPKSLNILLKSQIEFLYKNFPEQSGVSYGGFSDDKNTLNYIDESEHISRYGQPGRVSFYQINNSIETKLWDYAKNQPDWFTNSIWQWLYQTIGPGTHVPPHVDDSTIRKFGIIYLLDPGGDNVVTRWYRKKTDLEHLPVNEAKLISYDSLDCVYEHKLETNRWYIGDYGEIHSIENLTRMRTALGVLFKSQGEIST